jgi:ABC-type antimicrobial peptide transport system permease subunit
VTRAAAVRAAVAQVDADVPISDMRALDTIVAASVARPRLLTTLLLAFAAIGLALGAVGVYGVVAYAASQRTREIAVRISLGAGGRSIAALVVGHGARYAAIGLAIGGAAALLATRLMAALVFGVSATDPATFVGLGALVAALVVVASLLPARRAARVDPMQVLRGE